VQDQPPPPSEILLLPSLEILFKSHARNQELPQPGESRPVMPPSQNAVSNQMMSHGEPWEENMRKTTNKRMLHQLSLRVSQTIKATSTQDLQPLSLTNNDHPSVLPYEMFALDPGDPPSRTLNWKPLGFLSHIKRRTNDDPTRSFPSFTLGGLVLLNAWGANSGFNWTPSGVSL
jgi:hypothetical protein